MNAVPGVQIPWQFARLGIQFATGRRRLTRRRFLRSAADAAAAATRVEWPTWSAEAAVRSCMLTPCLANVMIGQIKLSA
jgi:hypothetical protein